MCRRGSDDCGLILTGATEGEREAAQEQIAVGVMALPNANVGAVAECDRSTEGD